MGKMLNFKIFDTNNFNGYLTGTDAAPRPGILLLQEIFGVNDAMRLAAATFAADGFVVLAPDLFHRIRPGIELGYSEQDRDTAIGYWKRLVDEDGLRDVSAAASALRDHPACTGRIAALGFCLGGKFALLSAAEGLVDAAVSFYPVQVVDYRERLEALRCPVQVHLGDSDPHISPEAREILHRAFANNPPHEYHLHAGAGHGFFNSVRSFGYDPQAAGHAHAQAIDFMRKIIV